MTGKKPALKDLQALVMAMRPMKRQRANLDENIERGREILKKDYWNVADVRFLHNTMEVKT